MLRPRAARLLAPSATARPHPLPIPSLATALVARRSHNVAPQAGHSPSPRFFSTVRQRTAPSARRCFATTPRRRNPTIKTETKPYLLADIGEGITECEIVKWFIKAGETVQEFDPICEVQSDKASVEITSRYAGKVTRLMYSEGDVARVGLALCEIEVESDAGADVDVDAPRQPAIEASAPPVAQAGQLKAQAQHPSASAGAAEQAPSESKVQLDGFVATPKSEKRETGEILATPAVRRVSREHDVDLADVVGTGKDGRITKEDVLRFIQDPKPQHSTSGQAASASSTSASTAAAAPEIEIEDLSPVRRAMFRAMSTSLAIPHFAYSDEVDVTALEAIRLELCQAIPARYRKTFPTGNGTVDRVEEASRFDKMTLLPLLVKAMSLAMHEHPLFRSTLSLPAPASVGGGGGEVKALSNGAKLHRRASHDVSIALSSPSGLLTPCLSGVEGQSVFEICARIVRLQTLATQRNGLTPSDLRKTGTVTLSNIGALGGGTYTHPVIPPTGQLAIGALGRSRFLPRFESTLPRSPAVGMGGDKPGRMGEGQEDRLVKRLIMPVSFTGDHRVVEGAELAAFVERWKTLVEQPYLWMGLVR
ncbi:hypothetical protein ACQY0O_001703 [Thecaphora frezii]